MRNSSQPTPASHVATQPTRTSTGVDRPPAASTWDSVRQWAADSGLDSPEALRQWIVDADAQNPRVQIDPARALLRALRQYSMAPPPSSTASPDSQASAPDYDALLRALSDPAIGSAYSSNAGVPRYPEGVDGPQWASALTDPLAEGGRLWPPSPVTVVVRMTEALHRAFGYAPIDSDSAILSLATQHTAQLGPRAGDALAALLPKFGWRVQVALSKMGDAHVDLTAPPLASAAEIAGARKRWPTITRGGFAQPYIFVVGRGTSREPTHVGLIVESGQVLVRLVVSDKTGKVIEADGVRYPRGPPLKGVDGARRLREAAEGDPMLIVELLVPFIDAARRGVPETKCLRRDTAHIPNSEAWPKDYGIRPPYMSRAFEPAEVLSGITAKRRNAAADIDKVLTSARGLASMAARAFRGDIATANVPEEVRPLIALQAMARACGPNATPQDRARARDAARVLNMPASTQEQGLTAMCTTSADIASHFYGRT